MLGGQAQVKGVAARGRTSPTRQRHGRNLTGQVRNIAEVTTAVANGDLSQKITVDVRGEVLELKNTINTMVDQLSSFAARSPASPARSAPRAASAARRRSRASAARGATYRERQPARGDLTTQVRAIAEVSTAVTTGDLTRQIDGGGGRGAERQGQHQPDDRNLRETTQRNAEQDWLRRTSRRIRACAGQRDLERCRG
jgi:hypothetical protein